jgi:hypothetical protein
MIMHRHVEITPDAVATKLAMALQIMPGLKTKVAFSEYQDSLKLQSLLETLELCTRYVQHSQCAEAEAHDENESLRRRVKDLVAEAEEMSQAMQNQMSRFHELQEIVDVNKLKKGIADLKLDCPRHSPRRPVELTGKNKKEIAKAAPEQRMLYRHRSLHNCQQESQRSILKNPMSRNGAQNNNMATQPFVAHRTKDIARDGAAQQRRSGPSRRHSESGGIAKNADFKVQSGQHNMDRAKQGPRLAGASWNPSPSDQCTTINKSAMGGHMHGKKNERSGHEPGRPALQRISSSRRQQETTGSQNTLKSMKMLSRRSTWHAAVEKSSRGSLMKKSQSMQDPGEFKTGSSRRLAQNGTTTQETEKGIRSRFYHHVQERNPFLGGFKRDKQRSTSLHSKGNTNSWFTVRKNTIDGVAGDTDPDPEHIVRPYY